MHTVAPRAHAYISVRKENMKKLIKFLHAFQPRQDCPSPGRFAARLAPGT